MNTRGIFANVCSTLLAVALLGGPVAVLAQECDPTAVNPNDAQNPALGPTAAVYDWEGEFIEIEVCYPSRQSGAQLHAWFYAPTDIETRGDRLPVVIIGPGSGNGRAKNYMWSGRELAGHGGYLALVYDPQGVGESEVAGDAESCGEEGCAGVPYQSAENFSDGFLSTLDFAFSRNHPWLQKADLGRVGIAGHSLSARAAAYVSGIDRRVSAVVAWDNLSSDLHGDAGISSGGGDCGAAIGGEAPGSSDPVAPRVPALGQASDAAPGCDPANTDPELKKTAYRYWRADGAVPVMQMVFKGAAHLDWTQTSSSDPAQLQLFQYYTRGWFDLYLKRDGLARARLLARNPLGLGPEQVFSSTFCSAVYMPEAGIEFDDLLPTGHACGPALGVPTGRLAPAYQIFSGALFPGQLLLLMSLLLLKYLRPGRAL